MGTWGYGPFDSDGASDLVAVLLRPVDLVLSRKSPETARYHYAEARAAAALIAFAHGRDVLGGPRPERLLEALAKIRSDVEWIAEFSQPRRVAESIEAEMASILRTMKRCARCQRTYGPQQWRNLRNLVDGARAVKVPKTQRKRRLSARLAAQTLSQGLPKKKARAGRRGRT